MQFADDSMHAYRATDGTSRVRPRPERRRTDTHNLRGHLRDNHLRRV
jgi:hypothetical protein